MQTDQHSLRNGSQGAQFPSVCEASQGPVCSYQTVGLTGHRPGVGEPALAGIARCQVHLSSQAGVTDALDHMELAVPWAHTTSTPSSLPKPPSASRLAQVWCICGPLAACLPTVLGSCQVKSWLARFDPTCELFYFPLTPLHGFGVLL